MPGITFRFDAWNNIPICCLEWNEVACRTLDKREYLEIIRDNFCQYCIKNICCDHSSEPSRQDGSD